MSGPGIVVGADGSAESLRAVEWAAREAARHNYPLHVVSVPEVWPYEEPPGKMADVGAAKAAAHAEREAADRAAAIATQRAAELAPDITVTAAVTEGTPAIELLASAAGAAMLVVGCRGSGGFSGLAIGSLSRYLATHAPLPVVVVREEAVTARPEIVVGVRNPRQTSGAALQFGFIEAALRDVTLVVTEALRPGRLAAIADVDRGVLTATRDALEHELQSWRQRHPEVRVESDVLLTHPARMLAAASARAELVVLGRHGSLSGAIGGVIHAVLAHAHGPVAVVPGDAL